MAFLVLLTLSLRWPPLALPPQQQRLLPDALQDGLPEECAGGDHDYSYNVQAAVPSFAADYTAGTAKYATTPAAMKGFEGLVDVVPRRALEAHREAALQAIEEGALRRQEPEPCLWQREPGHPVDLRVAPQAPRPRGPFQPTDAG